MGLKVGCGGERLLERYPEEDEDDGEVEDSSGIMAVAGVAVVLLLLL